MPSSVSRRSLAKGAAWVLPTAAVAVAAPAFAASDESSYHIGTSYGANFGAAGTANCAANPSGGTLGAMDSLLFTNYDPSYVTDSSQDTPLGFSVIGDTQSDGQPSPTVQATVTSFTFQVAFPAKLIDTSTGANGVPGVASFNGDAANWTVTQSTATKTNPSTKQSVNLVVYTMTFKAPITQNTVPEVSGGRESAWAGTRLGMEFNVNTNACVTTSDNYYWTSADATATVPGGSLDLEGSGWDRLPY